MDKIVGPGTSIERGWEVIRILKEATKLWPPQYRQFILILPEPGRVEVWSKISQRPNDLQFLKSVASDFVKGM